jgi:hypothetical protein
LRQVFRNGKWIDNDKAAPENLRADLRELPSELVTKDGDDPYKVHADDPDHVLETIVYDYGKHDGDPSKADAETKIKDPKFQDVYGLPLIGSVARLNWCGKDRAQWVIDLWRLRAAKALINSLVGDVEGGNIPERVSTVWHLWFPDNNLNNYELREGNPPPDSKRPAYMRGLDIVVDLNCPVPPIVDRFIEDYSGAAPALVSDLTQGGASDG